MMSIKKTEFKMCKVEGCGNIEHATGYCYKHYSQLRKNKMTAEQKSLVMEYVNKLGIEDALSILSQAVDLKSQFDAIEEESRLAEEARYKSKKDALRKIFSRIRLSEGGQQYEN